MLKGCITIFYVRIAVGFQVLYGIQLDIRAGDLGRGRVRLTRLMTAPLALS